MAEAIESVAPTTACLTQITSTESFNEPLVKYDTFYSPYNAEFYSKDLYKDLDHSEQQIRLLKIQPLGPGDDNKTPIQCELLENLSLESQKNKYTCISYAAGDPKKTEVIYVNGMAFNAFANLGHALRQARHFWKANLVSDNLVIWADQVCINQSKPRERSHQVSLMGNIYGGGQQVLVSLSKENDPAGGVKWMHEVLKDFPAKRDQGDLFTIENLLYTGRQFEGETSHRNWSLCIATIIKSPWWSRAWIRQELLRSQKAFFVSAYEAIEVSELYQFFVLYSGAMQGPYYANAIFDRIHTEACHLCDVIENTQPVVDLVQGIIRLLRAKINSLQGLSCGDLTQCLWLHGQWCTASDPRDMIYAFLGISSENYGIYPDYSRNVTLESLLIRIANESVHRNGGLEIFGHYNHDYHDQKCRISGGFLPSWVPDWGIDLSSFHIQEERQILSNKITRRDIAWNCGAGHKSGILRVRGVLIFVFEHFHTTKSFLLMGSGSISITPSGVTREGDELWAIEGNRQCLFVLRRGEKYRRLVDSVSSVPESFNFDDDDPSGEILDIC